jgi:hypothetical protein
MAVPRRSPRDSIDANRFAERHSRILDIPIINARAPEPPAVVVDIIRPADLVAMRVEVFGLELTAGDEPILTADADGLDDGHLIVHPTLQHIAEPAITSKPSFIARAAEAH